MKGLKPSIGTIILLKSENSVLKIPKAVSLGKAKFPNTPSSNTIDVVG
jgi:hypothetical protein